MEAYQQVGKNRVVINFAAFLCCESGKIVAPQFAIFAHGLGSALKLHGTADVSAVWLIVVAREVIGNGTKRRMQNGTVQALVVVQHDQLPVGLHLIRDAPMGAQISHLPMQELLRQIFQLTGKRGGLCGEVDEDVSVPDVRMNAIEGIVFAAEAVMGMGSADEAPVESVGPTVIAALDPTGEMSFIAGADAGTAMPAHIEKRLQRATRVASNDDTFARNFAEKIVARRRDLVGSPGADPVLAVEAFKFVAEQIRVSVV